MTNSGFRNQLGRTVEIPIELYESMRGRYFLGLAEGLTLSAGTSAWARLCNPRLSGVNLYLDTWSVSTVSESPFRVQCWLDANPSGNSSNSDFITPANLSIRPVPISRAFIQQASNVYHEPDEGVEVFSRSGVAGETLVDEENGKIIIPPCSSFLIYVSITDPSALEGEASISFEWWEDNLS
ncbi:MAG: PQQ-3 domain-containing protein [Thermocaproicibacter melissae]|jgi:hypothetical protein|uniref:DUF6143 family protein n=1 Tax=Thermocaproicibacter melissae TaxID=2966552 RepID=UPI0024B1DFB5|nr:DUF6143 family protein [Thermocaproicibacter melissae]WBY64590.1 DUF6143 family protein [Thermocaproicibacter melissae]